MSHGAERVLVLDPGVPEEVLSGACAELAAAGWRCEASRGEEQALVLVSGGGDEEILRRVAARERADRIGIGKGADLRRARATRRFLSGMVAALGLLTAVAVAAPIFGYLQPTARPFAETDVVAAGRAEDIPEGGARQLWLGGRPVALVRMPGAGFRAVEALCTHADDCRLAWDVERRQLLCPCHGCAFDVHGSVRQGPASIPLRRFAVEELGGRLFIRQEGLR